MGRWSDLPIASMTIHQHFALTFSQSVMSGEEVFGVARLIELQLLHPFRLIGLACSESSIYQSGYHLFHFLPRNMMEEHDGVTIEVMDIGDVDDLKSRWV